MQRLVKFRPRSVAEVERKLREKGFTAQVIEETVTWAVSHDLLDDEKFAQLWVAHRLVQRRSGPYGLRRELRQKGVDDEFISKALEDADIDEPQLLEELIDQRLSLVDHLPDETKQRRLMNYLTNRGFSFSEILKALKEKGIVRR